MTEIVGTDGEFTTDEISFQIRNIVVQELSRVLAGSNIPVLDMAANTADLAKLVTQAIAPGIAAYGLHPRVLHREHLAARRGRARAGQAHLDGHRGRSVALRPVQTRPKR
jgi:hypothetical protein